MTSKQYKNWRLPKPHFLAERVQQAENILWDFDIPICSLFSGFSAPETAQCMRDYLYERGLLQEEDYTDLDPLAIYRRGMKNYKYKSHRLFYLELEGNLRKYECYAATVAKFTPLAMEMFISLDATGRQQAIVTNNCPEAVDIYLRKWNLTQYFKAKDNKTYPFGYVFGRADADPKKLKPNPLFLNQAMDALRTEPEKCLMVGDSVSDFEAAKAAGVPFLGYTYTPDRAALLYQAGADIVINTYDPWLQLLEGDLLGELVV
jgi:phosphoglycolate phosphatase-like HAD superfamily hydrolase